MTVPEVWCTWLDRRAREWLWHHSVTHCLTAWHKHSIDMYLYNYDVSSSATSYCPVCLSTHLIPKWFVQTVVTIEFSMEIVCKTSLSTKWAHSLRYGLLLLFHDLLRVHLWITVLVSRDKTLSYLWMNSLEILLRNEINAQNKDNNYLSLRILIWYHLCVNHVVDTHWGWICSRLLLLLAAQVYRQV